MRRDGMGAYGKSGIALRRRRGTPAVEGRREAQYTGTAIEKSQRTAGRATPGQASDIGAQISD